MILSSYTCLVLSGGGFKGFSTLGALQFFADRDALSGVIKVIGTSVGALIGYLFIIGYSPVEIMVTLHQTRVAERLGSSFSLWSMFHTGGAVDFSILHNVLEDMTIHKVGHLLTMQQLKDEFGKELVCCTYNYSRRECEYISPATHPQLPCITALRMTSCLPLVFSPFLYEQSYYVDGALLNHFPIERASPEDNVLGIYLKTEQNDSLTFFSPLGVKRDFPFLSYILDILSVPLHSHAREKLGRTWPFACDVLEIDAQLPLFQLDLSLSQKFDTFSQGYNTAKRRFHSNSIMPYVPEADAV